MSSSTSASKTSINDPVQTRRVWLRAPQWALLLVLAAMLLPLRTPAVEQKLDVVRNGVTTSLVLPEYKSGDVPYASLNDIARQLGGTVEVDATRAVFRLGASSAEATLETSEMQSAGKRLTLQHPVRSYFNDALISMADLLPVLRDGFGYGTPENPPAGSALRLDPVEDPMEPIDTPPSPATTESVMEPVELESVAPLESPATPAGAAGPPLAGSSFANATDFLLAIDPGHGGEDTGAIGAGGLMEKDLCLAIATGLRQVLKEQYGIASVTTREKEEAVGLKARAAVVQRENATLVLSIHGGSNLAPGAQGTLLFAHRPSQSLSVDAKPGLQAAQVLARAMDGLSGNGLPAVYEVPLGLLRESTAPGVLVELGNLSNPEDEARLADPAHQARIVAALAVGINQLLGRPAPAGVVQ